MESEEARKEGDDVLEVEQEKGEMEEEDEKAGGR